MTNRMHIFCQFLPSVSARGCWDKDPNRLWGTVWQLAPSGGWLLYVVYFKFLFIYIFFTSQVTYAILFSTFCISSNRWPIPLPGFPAWQRTGSQMGTGLQTARRTVRMATLPTAQPTGRMATMEAQLHTPDPQVGWFAWECKSMCVQEQWHWSEHTHSRPT